MATVSIVQARLLRRSGGTEFNQRGGAESPNVGLEASGQSWAARAPVYYTGGQLTAQTGTAITKIAGMVYTAATGTANTKTRYQPILPGDIWVFTLVGSTKTTTLTGTGCPGSVCNFDIAAGILGANVDATTVDGTKFWGRIIDLYTSNQYPDGDTAGDTNGKVVVSIPDQPALQF